MMKKEDNPGRIVIPKEHGGFYSNKVFIIDTTEWILVNNPKYKTVKAYKTAKCQVLGTVPKT